MLEDRKKKYSSRIYEMRKSSESRWWSAGTALWQSLGPVTKFTILKPGVKVCIYHQKAIFQSKMTYHHNLTMLSTLNECENCSGWQKKTNTLNKAHILPPTDFQAKQHRSRNWVAEGPLPETVFKFWNDWLDDYG